MTSSEDEKADKASSFVDQKKGSKRSHLKVSDRADSRAGIAHAMRSSSNSAQTTDEKNVKKARRSASQDRQTHVVTASLSMSDMNADARRERRIGAANSQRKATMLKPSAKNSVKEVSSVRKVETMPNERSRAASREVESNGGGVCCDKSVPIRSPSSDEVEKTRGAEDDDELSSTKSTLRPGCVPCSSKSALSSTQSPVSDDVQLPEPVPPCVKCQDAELKSTPGTTQSQADACAKLREQQSFVSELPTGKPSTSSPIRVENPSQTDSSDVKMTKSESECEIELDDCDDRQPPTIETPSEINEGTVLASSERPMIENPIQSHDVKSESNSKQTERSAKNQKIKPSRSRSRSQKSNNSKVTSRDRKQSRDRKIIKKNCTLMNWNQFKKIAKALSLSTKSNASHCQCDLSPEPSESRKEEKATIPPSSVLSKTSIKKSTSSSSACIPCAQSTKISSHTEEAVSDNTIQIDHQPITSVPSSMSCARKYDTTASISSNQSKSRSSLEKNYTCHMCKEEEMREKAKLEVSRSQADSHGTNKPCPPTMQKCWEQNLKTRQGSTISKTKCVDSTSGPKTDRHPPSQQCQPLPKCWTHTIKDKLGPSSLKIGEEKSTAPSSSCKIRCAMNKPTSISKKDKFMDGTKKVTLPSPPSSCRVYCPANKTSTSALRAEKNDEPLQESTEKSVPPTSSVPKCSIHGSTNKPIATSLSDMPTTTSPKGTKEDEHKLLKKSISPSSENNQDRPKCWIHKSSDRPVDKPVKNETKDIKKLVSPSHSPKCLTHDKTNDPRTEAKYNTEPDSTGKSVTSPSKKCCMHSKQQKPISNYCARTQKVTNAAPSSSEGSFSSESPFPKCWTNTTNRPVTALPKTEKIQDFIKKSISPISQKSQCVPQCKSHSTTGKTVSNVSLDINKSEQVQSSSKKDSKHCPCDSYTTEKEPVAISSEALQRCGSSKLLEKYGTSTMQKCQPLPKCWVLSIKEESIPTTSKEESTSKLTNAQKKCEAVQRLLEKNILPTSQPKCWIYGTKDEPMKTSSNQSNQVSPKPQKKCGSVNELSKKDILSTSTLPKCQPLPKCWIYGTKNEIVSTIPKVQKKYDTGKGLIEESTPSMPQKCQPCSSYGIKNEPISSSPKAPDKSSIERNISSTLQKCQPSPKCWTHNIKDEPTSTPTIAQKKCHTGRRSTEKSVPPTLQKCQPLPKCWPHNTKDQPTSTPTITQKKCNTGRSTEKSISTTSQKCQAPKCWEYNKRDDEDSKPPVYKQTSTLSKTHKKCNTGRDLLVKQIQPTMQKCQPLPKRWVLSTKEKSVSTSSKDSSKCKKLLKCQPLPKCWIYGTKDKPVSTSTVDEPGLTLTKTQKKCEASRGLSEKYISPISPKCDPLPKCIEHNRESDPLLVSPASKECECKTESQLNNGASVISQKTENQYNPLSQCCTAEKPIPASTATDQSSSSTTSQVSTDLNKNQASKQKYSIEDLCAKTSPTVSSRSDSTTSSRVQRDLCGLSCSRKVSATGANAVQSVSTLSQNKKSNNTCSQTCSAERAVSTKPTPAPLSLDQTTQDQRANGMCPSFCYSQASKQPSTNKYVYTSSPSSSKDVDPKRSSSGSMNTYKCTNSRTTHLSSSSTDSTTKPKSTSQIFPSSSRTANIHPSGICKPCHLSNMEEETTELLVEKSTSNGASTTSTCGKPCNMQKMKGSTTETTLSGSYSTQPSCSSISKSYNTNSSSSKSSNLSSSESKQTTSTSSTSSEKFCQVCSNQKSIQHEASSSNSSVINTTVAPISNESNLASLCPAPCSTQLHKGQRQYNNTNTLVLKRTDSKSQEFVTMHLDEHNTSEYSRMNNTCQPCQSHSDKSTPILSETLSKSDNETTYKPICPESTLQPPRNTTQNQNHSSNTRINEVSLSHSNEHTSGSPRTNTTCQPCQSQSHNSDESAPTLSATLSKLDNQTTCKSIGPELTSQPPGNVTQNQTRSNNNETKINEVSSSHSEAASPECKECLRLRATPAPKCANCTKKSMPTKFIEGNSTLEEKENVGSASCPTICGGYTKPANADQSPASGTASKFSYETEVKDTQREIDNMINEGPVVHPDSLKQTKEDSPFANCMYPKEIESRPVEDEPGVCCLNKNGGPQLQCSIPTTTAPPKKENEVGSESTDLTDEETTNAADEEETDLADEEDSSSSVQYTNVSCPPDCDSTSDEKDEASVTTSQPKKQATKQITQPSRRVLEKKPLKQAPRKLRKRTIVDADEDEKELSRGLKNRTVPKRSGQQRTDDRSETKTLYRTNRGSQYRQNAKKTVCGRRRYSSTDSEERTLRGRISFRSRPRIPVTLTHTVHLRRRHTDQSRERMLAELNKKKKHNTRFQ